MSQHPLRRLPHATARTLRRLHLALALCWGPVMIPLTLLGPLGSLKNSVLWVICISYYANMAAHLSAWAGESATVAAEAAHEDAERAAARTRAE